MIIFRNLENITTYRRNKHRMRVEITAVHNILKGLFVKQFLVLHYDLWLYEA